MASVQDRRKWAAGYEGDRPWIVVYRDHEGVQKKPSFTRKAAAQAFALEVGRDALRGRLGMRAAGRQRLDEVAVTFFRIKKTEWEVATYDNRKSIWNKHVHPSGLAAMPVAEIRRTHVEELKADLLEDEVGAPTVGRAVDLVSAVLDLAVDDGRIEANPAARVKRPGRARASEAHRVSPESVEAIRAQLEPRDAAMVSIFGYAGLRPGELRALTWGKVWADGRLRVDATCRGDGSTKEPKGREGHPRTIPMPSALATDLDALGRGPDDAVIFGTQRARDGRPAGSTLTKTAFDNWRLRVFKPAAEAAGVDVTIPYDLRHSIASLWLRQGIDQTTVADWLGHSVAVLQKRYNGVIDSLDPLDRRSVDELIADARKA